MIAMVLPQKDSYTLEELFKNLPISFRELGRRSKVNKKTIDRVMYRKAKPRRSTINRLLGVFSEVYERPLTWDNVTGMDIEEEEEKPEHE